ncbi:MAG TPA: hypothetical protein VMR80_02625 [Candidatus Acidoferrum sp.]|nr:hypothetical protein [Candidatus Acidoferrum sp.]
MKFPRETSCEIQNALCAALGYLDACRTGQIPSDKLTEVLAKVEQQIKKALEAELKLFTMMGWDKFPLVQ